MVSPCCNLLQSKGFQAFALKRRLPGLLACLDLPGRPSQSGTYGQGDLGFAKMYLELLELLLELLLQLLLELLLELLLLLLLSWLPRAW